MCLLFSRYCILNSNTNIYFIFKYFFLCACKYFLSQRGSLFVQDVSKFCTFNLTGSSPQKSVYNPSENHINNFSRHLRTVVQTILFEAYFFWIQTAAASLNPYTTNPFTHHHYSSCVTFLRVYYSFRYFTTLTICI